MQRLNLKLHEKDNLIRYLEHENRELKLLVDKKVQETKKIDDSVHELGNVNEPEFNVKGRMDSHDIKKFNIDELQRQRTNTARSFEREKSEKKYA